MLWTELWTHWGTGHWPVPVLNLKILSSSDWQRHGRTWTIYMIHHDTISIFIMQKLITAMRVKGWQATGDPIDQTQSETCDFGA